MYSMYDTLMRLPLLGWVLFAVTLQLVVLIQSSEPIPFIRSISQCSYLQSHS